MSCIRGPGHIAGRLGGLGGVGGGGKDGGNGTQIRKKFGAKVS